MFVCVCNAVSDRTITAAIEDGASSLADLMVSCDAGTGCGTCHVALEQMLKSADAGPRRPASGRQLSRS